MLETQIRFREEFHEQKKLSTNHSISIITINLCKHYKNIVLIFAQISSTYSIFSSQYFCEKKR